MEERSIIEGRDYLCTVVSQDNMRCFSVIHSKSALYIKKHCRGQQLLLHVYLTWQSKDVISFVFLIFLFFTCLYYYKTCQLCLKMCENYDSLLFKRGWIVKAFMLPPKNSILVSLSKAE